ncbi:hypothetical protein P3575_24125, partial [Vibrio parahaemolyticus]|nr:hypothetical protein [Vibrio parahaemolyticus]
AEKPLRQHFRSSIYSLALFKQELCKFAGKPNQSSFSIGSIKTKSGSAAKCRLPTFVYTECAFFGAMGGVSK